MEPVVVVASSSPRAPANASNTAVTALFQEGLQRLQAGALAEAIELLGRARALDPDDLRTQLNLGLALQGAGRHAEALERFEHVRKSLPDDPAPLYHSAISLLALGKSEAALRAASNACSRAPQLPQALWAYGRALLALNKPAQAEQAFADALKHAPTWAEAWTYYGVARYRQGAFEDAKAAMRQALRHAPGHAAASANLSTLMRTGSKAEANASSNPETPTDAGSNLQAESDPATLRVWKPKNPAVSLGLAVEFLRRKLAFARLPFGEWSQVLVGQVNRGHFCFIVDQNERIYGFFGWALANQRLAEEWAEDRSGLNDEDCREGDCVIFNAWAANTNRVHRFMVDIARGVVEGKRTIYFKRHYNDGRTRLVRLAPTDFISIHLARAAARSRNDASDAKIQQHDDRKIGASV